MVPIYVSRFCDVRGTARRAPSSSKLFSEFGLRPIERPLGRCSGPTFDVSSDPHPRAEKLRVRSGESSDLDVLAPEIDLDVVSDAVQPPMNRVNGFKEHEHSLGTNGATRA